MMCGNGNLVVFFEIFLISENYNNYKSFMDVCLWGIIFLLFFKIFKEESLII